MASRFHQGVKDLLSGFNAESSRSKASEHLRVIVIKSCSRQMMARKACLLIFMVITKADFSQYQNYIAPAKWLLPVVLISR